MSNKVEAEPANNGEVLMGFIQGSSFRFCVVAVVGTGIGSSASAALVGQYIADGNYNEVTTVWTESVSGNNATGGGNMSVVNPTYTPNATPSGKGAVTFSTQDFLNIATVYNSASFTSAPNFTLIAVARPAQQGGAKLLLSNVNGNGGVGFRVDGTANSPTLTRINQADVGSASTGPNDLAFHVFSVTYIGGTSLEFRVDGTTLTNASGVNLGVTFGQGIGAIGTGPSFGGQFFGDIAELRIYDAALSPAALSSVEASLAATYIPEPTSLALLAVGAVGLLARRKRA